jgi:branched-chain amino acid transport system substrate-binding protein
MLKKKVALFLTLVFVVAMFSGFSSAKPVIKIGVVEPLTGGVSTFGNSAKQAIQILEKQTNDAGGINGQKVQFVYADDEGKAVSAATVGKKLISQDKVVAIVGPLTSGCTNALAPIAQANKIPLITGTATNPNVTQNGNFIFRSCFLDSFQGKVVANFAKTDLKAKTAAVLYNNGDDYSKGLAEFFQKAFIAAGGKIVDSETYSTNDTDFNAQLTKIQNNNPDVLFLPDYYNTVSVIAVQARALGLDIPLLGGDGWDSEKLTTMGGDAVNNSYFSNHYTPTSKAPEVVKFVNAYKAKYGKIPDAMAALNYDAAKIMLDAIKRAGKTDGESIRKALVKTNITVVSGHVTFDKNRDAVKAAVILKVANGKVDFLKTAAK